VRPPELPGLFHRVSSTLAVTSPELTFVVFDAGQIEAVRPAFEACRSAQVRPVVAALQSDLPGDVERALHYGACDFLVAPFRAVDLLPRLGRLIDSCPVEEKRPAKAVQALQHLVGQSQIFCAEVKKLSAIARSEATTLILGETGTGKEIFARAIHYLSPRAARPFVPVSCALQDQLVENELFGHERGAYSGATSASDGLVQEADRGTLFLDEVDTL